MKIHLGRLPAFLLAIVISALASVSVQSAVLIVANTADTGADSLRATVAAAIPGDTIEFALPASDPGYNPSTGIFTVSLTSGEIVIDKNLSITGPSAANIAISGNHSSRIFTVTSGSVQLSHLLLINGTAKGADGVAAPPWNGLTGMPGIGGAILNQGTLVITNCTFMENTAIGGRGANMTFNPAGWGGDGRGGAIANEGALSLVASTLTANSVLGGMGGIGGNTIPSSSPGGVGLGGAVYNAATATLTLTNCTITDNTASGGDRFHTPPLGGPAAAAQGGGVANLGTLAIVHSTLANNLAVGGDSVLPSGVPGGPGGASFGGGLYSAAGSVSSTRDTIFGENAVQGGNIGTEGTPGSATGPDVNGALNSQGHNLLGRSDGATGFTADDQQGGTTAETRLDPMLGLLDNYGGPTETLPLLVGSPAIDGGDAAGAARDQRNFLRAGQPDIGAFEFGGTQPVRLANISTRLRVETGDNALIGGLIVVGQRDKKVLLRAIGPSVPLSGTLADPLLYLYNSAGQLIATNDNWQDAANQTDIAATGIAPTNALESAILVSLAPGSYTAIVRGGNAGIGLVEAYDLDPTVDSKLGNISTRGFVQTGDNVLIGGFIVAGEDQQKVIIRAIGPSLTLSGKLVDPTLALYDGNGALVSSNDNWRSTQESEIMVTGIPPADDAESAIVVTLTPGPYTAIVRGKNNTTGIALVEAYVLD